MRQAHWLQKRKSLKKADLVRSSRNYSDKPMENKKEIFVLYFNTRDELIRVDLRKVLYFQSDRNYTDVYFVNGVHVTLPTGLMAIEQMLDDEKIRGRIIPFVRLGRCLIVNLSYILRINVVLSMNPSESSRPELCPTRLPSHSCLMDQ